MTAASNLHQHPVILELRELRRLLFESEFEFFSRARELEADESRWRSEFPTWDALWDFGNLGRVSRYRNWCKAVDEHGADTVREIGIDAAIALVRKNPPAHVVPLIVEHFKRSTKTNHFPTSDQNACNVIERFDPRPKRSGLVDRAEREKTAAEQLKDAKRRIVALERENAELRSENEALRERLSKAGLLGGAAKRTARKPSRKGAEAKGSCETR